MIKNILNLGDAAAYCDFGKEISKETNSRVIKYFDTLKKEKLNGINNLIPSYNKLIISFDLNKTNFKKIKKNIENLNLVENDEKIKKKIEIPVCCDDQFSPDIKRLENILKIKGDEVLNIFFNKEFFCYMTGFIAGMPFVGDLDKKIRAKRLETPRVKVKEGSIGITEQFCNIYTYESPGGWNIIGNTPKKIFDDKKENKPNLVDPGDTIIFKNISKKEYDNYNE